MPGDIDYVIDTACDPVISILISTGTVASEIEPLVGGVVRINYPLMVSIQGPYLAGPSRLYDEVSRRLFVFN